MSRRLIDLTGQTFGRLTVIGRSPGGGKTARWACRCACGSVHVAVSCNLRNGYTKSCGCVRGAALQEPSWDSTALSRAMGGP